MAGRDVLGWASFMAALGFALEVSLRCLLCFSADDSCRSLTLGLWILSEPWLLSLLSLLKLKPLLERGRWCGRWSMTGVCAETASSAAVEGPKDGENWALKARRCWFNEENGQSSARCGCWVGGKR